MPFPDVLILGGGVIGLTTAYFLARDGVRVAVVDKGDLGQESSWAGAGIISPGNLKRAQSPLGQLRARSAALFPELSAELRERTGIDNGYVRCGGLELRRSEDALEKLRIDNLLREERGEGSQCEVLSAEQLRVAEPALAADLPGAVYLPDMAQVRNPRHVQALVSACKALGVELRTGCQVHSLEKTDARIETAVSDAGPLPAKQFLITAGAWSAGLLEKLGIRIGIRPIRGQIVLFQTGSPLLKHIIMAGSEYLVPRLDGRVLAGSTEEDVGFVKQTTPEAIQHLRSFAIRLVPRLEHAAVEREWAGLRPGSPDGRPFLGPVPGYENLFIAAGHHRSGIQNSPGTAQIMLALLTGQPASMPIEAFRVDRPTL